MPKGLLMVLGGKKGSGSDEESEPDFLDEAFDALKDDDKAGFKAAMKSYVEACMSKGDDEEDDDHDDY